MKKVFMTFIPLFIFLFVFAGCVNDKMPERETIPQLQEQTNGSAQYKEDELTKTENEIITVFIKEYNANQTDKSLQVASDYVIYFDKIKGIYYVKSTTIDFTLRLDEDGKVISAALTDSDDIEKQLIVSNIIIDMLWNKEVIPAEQQQKINNIYEQAEKMKEIIAEKTSEFERNNSKPDTDLPEVTLPIK